jgi:hypothetical protein
VVGLVVVGMVILKVMRGQGELEDLQKRKKSKNSYLLTIPQVQGDRKEGIMNKSKSFEISYRITFKGRSKRFEGDHYTFQESFINTVVEAFMTALKSRFKTLKIRIHIEKTK